MLLDDLLSITRQLKDVCNEIMASPGQAPRERQGYGRTDPGEDWPQTAPQSWSELTECLRKLYCTADRLKYADTVRQVDKHP